MFVERIHMRKATYSSITRCVVVEPHLGYLRYLGYLGYFGYLGYLGYLELDTPTTPFLDLLHLLRASHLTEGFRYTKMGSKTIELIVAIQHHRDALTVAIAVTD